VCKAVKRLIKIFWPWVQTVLTATFNSYGNRQISPPPPHKVDIPELISTKSGHNWLGPWEDPLYQIWYKSTNWGLLGKWVKYNKKYFYLYLFFSGSRTGQTRGWIFTRDSSKDVKSRKDVPFGGPNDVPLNFEGKTPKNWNFGGVNRTFKPERQKKFKSL